MKTSSNILPIFTAASFRLKSIYNLLVVIIKIRKDLQFPGSEISNCKAHPGFGSAFAFHHLLNQHSQITSRGPFFFLRKQFSLSEIILSDAFFLSYCFSLISELFSQTDFLRHFKASSNTIRTPLPQPGCSPPLALRTRPCRRTTGVPGGYQGGDRWLL